MRGAPRRCPVARVDDDRSVSVEIDLQRLAPARAPTIATGL